MQNNTSSKQREAYLKLNCLRASNINLFVDKPHC